jgi:hypothetical protein
MSAIDRRRIRELESQLDSVAQRAHDLAGQVQAFQYSAALGVYR